MYAVLDRNTQAVDEIAELNSSLDSILLAAGKAVVVVGRGARGGVRVAGQGFATSRLVAVLDGLRQLGLGLAAEQVSEVEVDVEIQ